MTPPPDSHPQLLEAVVREAIAVAKRGASATPAVGPPKGLEPFLHFKRLPPAAVEKVIRVLEDDPAFRTLVQEASNEASLGRAGWLWLTRPDGWQERYDSLAEAAVDVANARSGAADERSARQRLPKLQKVVDEQRQRLDTLEHELADRERVETDLADRLATATSSLAELTQQVEDLTADRQRAVRELKSTEQRLVERTAELRATRADLVSAQKAAAASELAPAPAPAPAPESTTPVPATPTEARSSAPDGHRSSPAPPALDRAAVAEGVRAAATHAERLSEALAAIADHVASPVVDLSSPRAGDTRPGGGARGADIGAKRSAGKRRPRRRPPPLPGGVRNDGVEAAAHWLQSSGVVFIVDGYNVSNTAWGSHAPREQRQRLERVLNELAMRHGTRFEVVYDGAFDRPSSLKAVHSTVQLRFTEAGVEADDVIISMVPDLAATTGAVVVSSDRRVRDAASASGAAVVYSHTLLEVAGIPVGD
jgi:predicted RNA-binding protein with PIN domain/TolA-binding protein